MADPKLDVHLSIRIVDRRVIADLTFLNRDNRPIGVYNVNAFVGGEIENDLFRILDEHGRELPYVGPLAKRRQPGPGDFIMIDANDKYEVQVDLSKVYKFPAGRHTFTVKYSALNPYPNQPGFFSLESNPVTFTFDH